MSTPEHHTGRSGPQGELPLRVAIVPVTPFQQNCMIIKDTATGRAAIVDPGGDVADILRTIDQLGVTVEKILLTHGHLDHAGGVADLVAARPLPVEGPHRAEQPILESIESVAAGYGIEGLRNAWSDRYLLDGDTVSVGTLLFDVLHIPGHSPGSVVYVARQAPVALVGDVLFQGSIGRTDLPLGNHDQLIRGIRTKLLALDDDVVCLPGHGPATTIGRERRTNPYLA